LFKDISFLQNPTHSFCGLRSFFESLGYGRLVQPYFIGSGVVEAQFFQGTTIPAGGAMHRYNPIANFPLFAESL
jgi:hypothetical protein